MRRITLAAVLGTLALAASANATVIVNDGFEYADQAAFQTAWPAVGTSTTNPSALLSNTQAASGNTSIYVPGTTANNEYRNKLTVSETGTLGIGDQLIWSFDFYDSSPTGNPQRNFVNLQDGAATGTNQLISLGLYNTQTAANSGGNYYMARILGYTVPATDPDGGPTESLTGSGTYFKLNDFGVGLRSQGWHNLKVILSTDNGTSTDFAFYVDNQLAELVSNVGTAASIRSYESILLGSALSNASTSAYFDNMYLEFVPAPTPEPASLSLLALAAAPLLRRRSR